MIKTKSRSFLFDTVKMTAPERNGFDLSHENKQTCKSGYLYPFEVLEALPNDDFQIQVEQFIRLQPMLSPTMHRLKSYWHWFFVPNRLTWNYWEEFISRGNGKKLDSSQEYVPPEPVSISLYDMIFCYCYKAYDDPDYLKQRVTNYMNSNSKQWSNFTSMSIDEQSEVLRNAFPEFIITTSSSALGSVRYFICYSATPRVATSMGICDTCILRGVMSFSTTDSEFTDIKFYNSQSSWTYDPSGSQIDDIRLTTSSTISLKMSDLHQRLNSIKLSVMPFVAYAYIYNEYYRDENLIDDNEYLLNYFREETGSLDCSNFFTASYVSKLLQIYYRAWEKDYFTTATQMPQKAPDVLIPNVPTDISQDGDFLLSSSGRSYTSLEDNSVLCTNTSTNALFNIPTAVTPSNSTTRVYSGGLKLNNQGQGTTVADVRKAFALQRWFEKAVRCGTRYIETLKAFFNSDAGDARLQRPEYIGGMSEPVQISDVVQNSATADGSDTPQGNLAGYGISAGSSDVLSYHAPEHGFVFGIFSILARTSYSQGIPKLFSRETWLDYAFPEFEHIGEQGVLNKELYAAPLTKDCITLDESSAYSGTVSSVTANQIFGYQSRYSEYKQLQDRFGGAFSRSLDFWSLGRIFYNEPTLSKEFVEANISDRNFAVVSRETENPDGATSSNVDDVDTDQYICDFWLDIRKVTSLTLYSEPI